MGLFYDNKRQRIRFNRPTKKQKRKLHVFNDDQSVTYLGVRLSRGRLSQTHTVHLPDTLFDVELVE